MTDFITPNSRLVLTAVFVCLGAAAAHAQDSGGGTPFLVIEGDRGRGVMVDTQGEGKRVVEFDGNNGHGATVNTQGYYDAETGTYIRSGVATANSGATADRNIQSGCELIDGELKCNRTAVNTTENREGTRTVNRSYKDGVGVKEVTREGSGGYQKSRKRWINVNP